jgi:hypothetical protein
MANLKGLESIVSQLREQRASLVNELRHVDAALAVLGKLEGGSSYTKLRRHSRRTMSASARRRISLAQKRHDGQSETRWAGRVYPNGTSQQHREGKWQRLNARDGQDSIREKRLRTLREKRHLSPLMGAQMPVV